MQKVFVTGISGFVGSHCAAELLKKGYAVKGSVRNLSKSSEVVNGINKQVDSTGRLEFCTLDLTKDEGWETALAGCEYLLHVASPFVVKEPKDENELIKPAVDGTLRALKAAKKAGLKRVVLTSSIVAMLGDANTSTRLTPNSWTNVNAKNVTAYLKSKTLAEKSAWEFINAQEGPDRLELVVINPGPIYGPTLTGNLSGESMDAFKKLITGKLPMLPNAISVMSDVRDIATIHVQALENNQAAGKRFIVSSEKSYSLKQLATILKSNGYAKVSTTVAPDFMLKFMANFLAEVRGALPFIGLTYDADISETKKVFNWKPIAFEKMVLDTAKSVELVLKNNQ